jgi:hypothetical protein
MALKQSYSWRDYWPLMIIVAAALTVGIVSWLQTESVMRSMTLFMGTGLTLLASLKIINVRDFAMTFAKYDLIAGGFRWYAHGYPFLELALGIGYLLGWQLIIVNAVTFVVMTIGAVGVYQKMQDEEVLMCACLGAVFNVPMTWVTLVEDIIMAGMAGGMLLLLL